MKRIRIMTTLVLLLACAASGVYAAGGIVEPATDDQSLIYGYLEIPQTANNAAGWVGISKIYPNLSDIMFTGQQGKVFFLGGVKDTGIFHLAQYRYSIQMGRTSNLYIYATGLQGKPMSVKIMLPGLYYMGAYRVVQNGIEPIKSIDEKEVLKTMLKAFARYPTWKKKVQDRLEELE